MSVFQLLLSVCFVHPHCYPAGPPSHAPRPAQSALARKVETALAARRTETARTVLLAGVDAARVEVKTRMFQELGRGVAAKGTTIRATRHIIDAIKVGTT